MSACASSMHVRALICYTEKCAILVRSCVCVYIQYYKYTVSSISIKFIVYNSQFKGAQSPTSLKYLPAIINRLSYTIYTPDRTMLWVKLKWRHHIAFVWIFDYMDIGTKYNIGIRSKRTLYLNFQKILQPRDNSTRGHYTEFLDQYNRNIKKIYKLR